MYTFKIVNGDIAVRGDGVVSEVSGAERIEQELACWILEPLRTDAMHPDFGSIIGNYVGSPALNDYLLEIRTEVSRIVNNYIAYQQTQVDSYREGSVQDYMNAWNDDDLIQTVNDIKVVAVADTVSVTVRLTTAGGRGVVVSDTL